MKGKIFVDRANVINWMPENPTGDLDGIALAMETLENLVQEQHAANILVDLSRAHRPDQPSRELIINTLKRNSDRIGRIALFGQSPLMKVVAHFIINAAGFQGIQFFSSRQDAHDWLTFNRDEVKHAP